jgi:hypothetical protein
MDELDTSAEATSMEADRALATQAANGAREKRYWSSDGESVEFHETEDEARRTCERSLEMYRDGAAEGWDEAVANIGWGSVRQRAIEGPRIYLSELDAAGDELRAEHLRSNGWDYTSDYLLTDLPPVRSDLETKQHAAIQYVLRRAQTDPDFRYHMLLTEAHQQLIEAEAVFLGEEVATVKARREQDRQPSYRRREPVQVGLEARIKALEEELVAARRAGREW